MAIRIRGQNTGPFGGPQGSTLQAMMQLMQGYLMGEKKREEQNQMDLLGKIFSQQGQDQAGQPTSGENIIEQILKNRELNPQTRMLGIRAAQALPRYKSPEFTVLKYWDKSGKKHQKRVPVAEFNQRTQEIESQGGVWEAPSSGRKVGDTRTFNRAGKQITQEWNGQKWVNLATSPKWQPKTDETMDEQHIRKELTRLEVIKQKAKTGGMSPELFAMLAISTPELANKIQMNPEDADIELDRYMNFLRDKLPEGAAGKPSRWVIEGGQFVKKKAK